MHDEDVHIVGNAALTSSLTTAGVTGIALTNASRGALTAAGWAARTATWNGNKKSRLVVWNVKCQHYLTLKCKVNLLFLQVVHWQLVHLQVAPQLQVPATEKDYTN